MEPTDTLEKIRKRQESSHDCFVCGADNKLGFQSMFYETEKNELICLVYSKFEYQSYPQRLHGGISATLLDETMGRAILIYDPDTWGVTVDMQTRFLKPVPLEQTLRVIARITDNRRIFEAEGEILLEDGTKAVTAKGRYLKMPVQKISDTVNRPESVLFMEKTEKEIAYISGQGPLEIIYQEKK